MYIAFTNEFLREQQSLWEKGRERLIPVVFSVILCLFIALLGIIYLIFLTVRRVEEGEVHISWLDNQYTELLFSGFIPLIVLLSSLTKIIKYDTFTGYRQIVSLTLIGIVAALATILSIIMLLSLVRKIKLGRFFRKSIML